MKKVFFVILSFTIVLSLCACGSSSQDNWEDAALKDYLPSPSEGKLRLFSNDGDRLSFYIEKVGLEYYNSYKQECVEMGYTTESEDSETEYDAFNPDGYKLSLTYYDFVERINVDLDAPEQLGEIEWPTTGIATKLPSLEFSSGKIFADRSDYFSVLVGETTLEEYRTYVSACEDKGFIRDYSKEEKSYIAKDETGEHKIYVYYEGNNRVKVTIETIEDTAETTATTTRKLTTATKVTETGIGSEFKAAMDSYEKFMDDYVAFMKKYQANPHDFALIADYAKFMSDYAEVMADFEAWEDENLNDAELAYYIDVQARVSKKLLEVAN